MIDDAGTDSKRQFVLDQLAQYSGETKKIPDSTFVLCPFHAEKTPSGRIYHGPHLVSPYFKCYGCGETATWNKVSPLLGLKPFGPSKPQDEFANTAVMSLANEDEIQDEEIVYSKLPANKRWREIPTNLLIALGAKFCKVNHPDYGWQVKKIWLPVYVNGNLKGYIKARLKKHAEYSSYINSKGVWSKTHGLFPYDYSVQMMRKMKSRTIVLVEGPRDALRLLAYGIPAMCILGTQSWTATKTKILELSGAKIVVLLMDGDCAGIACTTKLNESLKQMFDVKVLRLWKIKGSPYIPFADEAEPSKAAKEAGVSLWDPGSCPEWILAKIKSKYF